MEFTPTSRQHRPVALDTRHALFSAKGTSQHEDTLTCMRPRQPTLPRPEYLAEHVAHILLRLRVLREPAAGDWLGAVREGVLGKDQPFAPRHHAIGRPLDDVHPVRRGVPFVLGPFLGAVGPDALLAIGCGEATDRMEGGEHGTGSMRTE